MSIQALKILALNGVDNVIVDYFRGRQRLLFYFMISIMIKLKSGSTNQLGFFNW